MYKKMSFIRRKLLALCYGVPLENVTHLAENAEKLVTETMKAQNKLKEYEHKLDMYISNCEGAKSKGYIYINGVKFIPENKDEFKTLLN